MIRFLWVGMLLALLAGPSPRTSGQSPPGAATSQPASKPAADQLDRNSPLIRRAVLAKIRPITEQDREMVRKLMADLVGEDDKAREDAFKRLDGPEGLRLVVILSDNDEAIFHTTIKSDTQKRRLRQIKKRLAQVWWLAEKTIDYVGEAALADNVPYLVGLLGQVGPADAPVVAARLSNLTGQRLGRDVKAWQAWLRTNSPFGAMELCRQPIGDLVNVATDKTLRLNRKHYEMLASQRIEQIRKAYVEYYKGHASMGGFPEKELARHLKGPPVVVALRQLQVAQAAWGGRQLRGPRYGFIRNPGAGLYAELTWRDEALAIILEDHQVPRRLEVWDDGKGGFCLLSAGLADGSLLALQQRLDGSVQAGCVDAQGVAGATEASLEAFCRKHLGWVDGRILQPLRHMGVTFGELPPAADTPVGPITRLAPPTKGFDRTEGWLQNLAGDVGRFIGVATGPDGLRIDRAQWRTRLEDVDKKMLAPLVERLARHWPADKRQVVRDAILAMELLKQAAQGVGPRGGGSGAGRSGGRCDAHFRVGDRMAASVEIDGVSTSLSVEELSAPYRKVEVNDNGQGRFRLQLTDHQGRRLLIRQDREYFIVAELGPEAFFLAREASFLAFCRKYPQYSQRMMQQLTFVGLTVPPSPYSKAVTSTVVARLMELTPADLEAGRLLIRQLDDNKWKVRERATTALIEQFARHKTLLAEARKAPELSAEVKSRLKTVHNKCRHYERAEQLVDALRLTENPLYLRDLLARAADEPTRKAIADQLKQLGAK